MEMKLGYSVYAILDDNNVITQINSEIFIQDFEGWTLIEENVVGDRGAHAQGNYLPKGLMDNNGKYNYKYENELIELSDEDKELLFPTPAPQSTFEERVETLEFELNVLLGMGV